ncbi:MAG: acyltransferase [Clostridia bacterium]|nr:acyltransferase [Clostridia bacterium]
MKLKSLFHLLFQKETDPFVELEKNGCYVPLSTRESMHSPNGIDSLFPYLVKIGENCIVSSHVSMITHDAATSRTVGAVKVGKIEIGNNCYIGYKVTILPGVTIGDNTIIGANSLVCSDCESNSVYVGNPAKRICSIAEYIEKRKKEIEHAPLFEHKDGYKYYKKYKEHTKECDQFREEVFRSKIGYIKFKK